LNPHDDKTIRRVATVPESESDFAEWILQNDLADFLQRDLLDDRVILYASFSHLFLHAVLVPPFDPKNESEIADLMDWSLTVDSTWALTTSGDDAWIAPPLDFVGSKHLGKGEKLVFLRDSDLVDPKRTYIEISQKLTHTLSLHHIPERKAWCKTDDRGDVDEVIKVHDFDATDAGRVISMDMRALRQYAGLTGQWLFRMFDVPRYRSGSFHGFASEMSRQSIPGGSNLHGWIHVAEKYASVSRGIQWANPGLTKAEIARTVWGSDAATEQYESFIAWDWRNQTVDTFSCDPAELANYFVPADGPFQTSPAFFKPEVLRKYKADPEKYAIEGRTISCRGAWYLKGWGVNDAGQVHAYLCDLGKLPHTEQLHWKSFNEEPKAGLSESVIATDFEGRWSEHYEPLESLRSRCRELHEHPCDWWRLRDEELLRRTQYPLTDTRQDWSDELLNLDQMVVESIVEKPIRKRAKSLGRELEHQWRGIRLLQECLIGLGFDEQRSKELVEPLSTMHFLRSALKGHASGSKQAELEKEARNRSGTLLADFKTLCERCDENLHIIADVLNKDDSSPDSGN
jgi:hypothetical protein